ncbi:hypothetical protein H4582DRAFT_2055781 [Lactarius indigo]|nr:hypothetical protein H4582DRAFT_2055781 [Lactarius indigo]
MSSPRGAFSLSCRAYLEQPRTVPGKPRTIVLDALVFCANNTSPVPCRLRHLNADDSVTVTKTIYDIFAPVVSSPSSVTKTLRPVPVEPKDANTAWQFPARVVSTGIVTSVDKEHDSFVITLSQYVDGGTTNEQIAIRGLMERGPRWPDPPKMLPSASSRVHFTGKLFQFEDNPDFKQTGIKSRIVVALDHIIYLSQSNNGYSGDSAVSMSPEDADTVALRDRAQKDSHEGETSQTTTPNTDISLKQKCKRKVSMTDGDVEEEKNRDDKKPRSDHFTFQFRTQTLSMRVASAESVDVDLQTLT